MSGTCVIMQPTYLPWAGYMNLASEADVFVLLDDVQFARGTWQNRNRVLVNGEPRWLTVPARRSGLHTALRDVVVDDARDWRSKHLATIGQAYADTAGGTALLEVLTPVLKTDSTLLVDINAALLSVLAANLGIETRFVRASATGVSGDRSGRLVELCRHFQCDNYLSPRTAREYLEADGAFEASEIELRFHSYEPGAYPQRGTDEFVSHLSIADVVAHLGWQAAGEYVAVGSRASSTPIWKP